MGASLVPALEQIDKQLENVTEWRIARYYVKQWASLIKLGTEFLEGKLISLARVLIRFLFDFKVNFKKMHK